MKVLAFAASNSRNSINKKLVRYAARILEDELGGFEVELIDLNDFEMPLYSIDRQNADGIPEAAMMFLRKIGEADAVLISFAEHNGSFSVAYKNVYDWASRAERKVYQDRPMVLLSTSNGSRGGMGVLQIATNLFPYFGGVVKATLSVPRFKDNFDAEKGELTDPDLQSKLREALNALKTPS